MNNERRRKGKEQASSSVPTGKGQTDDKRWTSLEASPATGAIIPCLWGSRCKISSCDFRHPPVCRNFKSGEEKPSKKSKKESTQGVVVTVKEKKGPRLCISKFRSKEVHSAESWADEIERFGGTRYKIIRTHLVRNLNPGKKRTISRRYPKR